MKRNIKKLLLLSMSFCAISLLSGCGSKTYNDPKDAIIDSYGDKQFRISFDSTNLDEPLADIFYSARNMPTLPSPVKVGYVFDGWYFDENYTNECNVDNGDLYWKMSNVTLYAKWESEKIVNNGEYDIEFEAKIVGDVIKTLATSYQKFPEDILTYGTCIEKNKDGTFLKILYDSKTRGPVLGGSGANEDNFAQQTYTISDKDNRINKKLSIFDRTSTLQTLYYNIEGLDLADPIFLNVTYYNWDPKIVDDLRDQYKVNYNVQFNITRFIGFGASFINPEATLENGIYTIPTHYTKLDKSISMLDMFNPVTSYLRAKDGKYTLYKPLSAYNNDTPTMEEKHYPLRSTGFAKEFACFLIDSDTNVTKEQEENANGDFYIPSVCGAKNLTPITCEFNSKTGQYYYIIELGDSLDKDIVFYGGSTGFMESFVSLNFDYRRLVLDYDSVVRMVDWEYTPLEGDSFCIKDKATLYLGSSKDFDDSNTDYNRYLKQRSANNYSTVFYTENDGKIKVYDSSVKIKAKDENLPYISQLRKQYIDFDISYEIYGYDPIFDGQLYSRDLSFISHGRYNYSNSSIVKRIKGKSFEIGDNVSLIDVYKELVNSEKPFTKYKAFEVGENLYDTSGKLTIDFNKPLEIDYNFKFNKNIAVYFENDFKISSKTGLVVLAKKQKSNLRIQSGWELDSQTNILTYKDTFKEGTPVTAPEIQYTNHGVGKYTRDLYKNDDDKNNKCTDFTTVSFWSMSQGIAKNHSFIPGGDYDFLMGEEKIVALYQLVNPFNEFEVYQAEFTSEGLGYYSVKDGQEILTSGDIQYKNSKRKTIIYESFDTLDIVAKDDISKIKNKYILELNTDTSSNTLDINLDFALVYLKKETLKITNINEIWEKINAEPYAVIYLFYKSVEGDQVLIKGQYRFKIQGDSVNKFNVLNTEKSIFTNQTLIVENPVVTNFDNENLTKGNIRIFTKNGNNYVPDALDAYTLYYSNYDTKIEFHEAGEYLLTYSFKLTFDENGEKVFEAYDPGNSYTTIDISISQKIEVIDVNSKVTLTFATDLNHKFNRDSKELVGYKFKVDSNYEYAYKEVTDTSKLRSLSVDAFLNTTDVLYKWGDKNNKLVCVPDVHIRDVHIKTGTVNPVLYARWDKGSVINTYIEVNGKTSLSSTLEVFKDSSTGSENYSFDSNLIAVGTQSYVLYGWKADRNIFSQVIEINGEHRTVMTNFHKGSLHGYLSVPGETNFTAILKKVFKVSYEAYDEAGKELTFLKSLEDDYGLFEGVSLGESLSTNKLHLLKTATCKEDLTKELLRWEVVNNSTGEILKINPEDIGSFVLDIKYSRLSSITLKAIFR